MLAPNALLSALTLLVSLSSLSSPARSSSSTPPPLSPRALSHPQDLTWHLIPRSPPAKDTVNPLTRRRERERRSSSAGDAELDLGLGLTSDRQPEWDDRFLLSFLLPPAPGHEHEEAEAITLSLRPSAHLVAPSLRSTVRTRDEETGEWVTVEQPVRREDVRAYEGWVVPTSEGGEEAAHFDRWVREEIAGVVRYPGSGREGDGWARIVLSSLPPPAGAEAEEDGGLRFQGAFTRHGEQYTIHHTARYLSTRSPLDPDPPRVVPLRTRNGKRALAPRFPSMVVVRESAVLSRAEAALALRKRGLPIPEDEEEQASCSHDQLAFNTDPAHPVLLNAWEQGLYGVQVVQEESAFSPLNSSLLTPFLAALSPRAYSPFSSDAPVFVPLDRASSPSHVHPAAAYPPRQRQKRQGDDISGGSGTSSNFINSIGSTTGCPKQALVVFVGVAADCTYVSSYGSAEAAREQILTDFNTVSAVYQQSFNVSLGIVELAVMNATCPTTSSEVDSSNPWNLPCPSTSGSTGTNSSIGIDLNSRLSVFSQWRGDKGGSDGAGLWHLLTACQTGSEVGVAWLGTLCRVAASSSGGQTTSGTAVTAITRSEWQVIAHETGHNFGAIHDCSSGCSLSGSCCPLTTSTCNADADYIMSPVSQKNVSSFSPCSIGNICTTLSNSLNTSCLATPGASGNPSVISLQACGNGILEDGEDCDPGSDGDSDPCCDASTCKFANGATCDPRNSLCCTSSCQIAGSGTVCRAAVDSRCDEEETCDGSSAQCPEDKYKSDGSGCGDGLSCASGVCTSRDEQCQNAGTSLNLRSACSQSASTGCSIACVDPTRSNSCVILDQSFRDGTSCGYGGRCRDGSCQSGSALDTAKSWYTQNLRISIPVTIVVGIIVLLLLWALLRCLCCGGFRRRQAYKPPKNAAYSGRFAPPPGAPPMQNQGQGGYGNGYYPPPPGNFGGNGGYGAGGGYAPPPGPPPSHPSLIQRPEPSVSRVLRR
ncbi:hypothetical protein JCM10207_007774 [Rhodosporidiobolus poonsookiae]